MDENQFTNRCPMCGKENAPDVKRCTFCHAALQAFKAEPIPSDTSAEDDWLNNLRAGNGFDNSANQAELSEETNGAEKLPPEEAEDDSDWLQRLGQGGVENEPEASQDANTESVQSSGDEPFPTWTQGESTRDDNSSDFLSDLRKSTAIESEEASSEEDSDDWLDKLRQPSQDDVLTVEEDSLQTPDVDAIAIFGTEEDNLNRLDSLSSWQSRLSLDEQEAKAKEDTTPLSEPKRADEDAGIDRNKDDSIKNLEKRIPFEDTSQESMEVPSWLQDLQNSINSVEPVDYVGEQAPVPDWMQGLVPDEGAFEPPIESKDASPSDESYQTVEDDFQPDWLQALQSSSGNEEPASTLNEGAASDLLKESGKDVEQLAEEIQSGTFSHDDEDSLSELRDANIPELLGDANEADQLPDWLKDFDSVSEAEGLPLAGLDEVESELEKNEYHIDEFSLTDSQFVEEQTDTKEEPLPISEDEKEGTASEKEEILSEVGELDSVPRGEILEEEVGIPDWLTALQPETVEDSTKATLPFEGGELPDWMKPESVRDEPEFPAFLPDFEINKHKTNSADSEVMPFEAGELPAWLDDVSEPFEKASSGDLLGTHEDISPAELPTWLKQMKPRTAPNQSYAELNVFQQIGPLAGLQEVLPTSEQNRTFPASRANAGKLLVSDDQKKSAEIISTLLNKMGDSSKLSLPSHKKKFNWLRPAMAMVLVLAILIPLILGNRFDSEPPAMSAAATQAFSAVQNLEDESTVLVAFDFEPAYSGELSYATKAMLQQLFQKNARLVFVSTNATGPVLAESFLQESIDDLNPQWSTEAVVNFNMRNVANLGYLTGGTASLQEFVNNPHQATRFGLRAALDGVSTWTLPALNNLDSVDDFALVIVLTHSSEIGRTWVEQVQPHLNGNPIIMVCSSVAAPMLMPYVESGQINGLVAGINNGYGYQALAGQGNYYENADGALKTSSLVVTLFLLAGLIFFGIQNWRSNRIKE